MKRNTVAVAAAIMALSAGAAVAQAPPPGPGRGPPPRMMHRPDPAQVAERHAQHLRTVLQLTPAQEPALKAFLEANRPPMDRRERMRGARPDQPLTTPQKLDQRRARLTERLAEFDRHAAAVKRFYAALTPSQQKAFDALQGPGGRGHGRGHHGPRGMHGPRGPGGPGSPPPGAPQDHQH